MFRIMSSAPAGYGYFTIDSVADKNIIPDIVKHLKLYDKNNIKYPIVINYMDITVLADANISINNRAPVLVKANEVISFESTGINSLRFLEDTVKFNIHLSYQ